jgi:hypothetical protein
MCSFCARKQSNRRRLSWRSRFSEFNVDVLVSQEFHHLSPVEAPLPVSPYNGMTSGRWRRERSDLLGRAAGPENNAYAARFLGGRPVALTFLTHWAGTAVTDAGGIDYPHTAVTFRTAFLRIQRKTSRTLDGAVWLRGKVLTRDTSHP